MNEDKKLTIEEWAGEHGFEVTDEQTKELIDALNVCNESVTNVFQGNKKSEKDVEIDTLKRKLMNLETFINSKGYSIDVRINGVIENSEERITNVHVASREVYHRY